MTRSSLADDGLAPAAVPVHVSQLVDHQLARRCAQGDAAAFRELAQRHRIRLLTVCRRITCHDQDALDALQETLISAWRGMPRFDGRSAVSTWMYRIAIREAIDQADRSRRGPVPLAVLPEREDRRQVETQVADQLDIDRAFADISPDFRAAVLLHDRLGLSYAEIAEVCQIKIDTVKSRIFRGRRLLRVMLGA